MQQHYFDVPFAFSGDKTSIPDPLQVGGTVSFTEGWNFNYQRNMATDPAALPIDRSTMNWLFNSITVALQALQQTAIPEWIKAADNGGVSFPYIKGAEVLYSASGTAPFTKYVSLINNNADTPGATGNWQVVVDAIATSAQASAGTDNTTIMTPALVAQQDALRALLAGNSSQVFNVALATASTHAVQLSQVTPVGQCKIVVQGGNIVLQPYNGNKLMVGGQMRTIPSAGISIPPTGLTVSTVYYIYAFMNGSTLTLEASATGHSPDAATGVEIKTGDATRTLVAAAYIVAGPAFSDTNGARYVRDWFNRRRVLSQAGYTTGRSTSAASPTEINSEIRNGFFAWEGEVIQAETYGTVAVTGAAGTQANTYFALDSTTSQLDAAIVYQRDANSNIGSVAMGTAAAISEGVHYLTLLGSTSGTSAQWGSSNILKTVLGG